MKHNIITERLAPDYFRVVVDVRNERDEPLPTWQDEALTCVQEVADFGTDQQEHETDTLKYVQEGIESLRTVENVDELVALITEIGSLAYQHVLMTDADLAEHLTNKQRDYGVGNILAFGYTGLHVRMSDKAARLANMLAKEDRAGAAEPLADAWLDLVGYAVIARMLYKGTFQTPIEHEHQFTTDEFQGLLQDVGGAVIEASKPRLTVIEGGKS